MEGICNFGTIEVCTSYFEKNYASRMGSGISIENNTNIAGCIFKSNYARINGDGIHNAANTIVKNSQFISNTAKISCGGVIDSHAPLKVYNLLIKYNKALYAVEITLYRFNDPSKRYSYPSHVLIEGCIIQENIAKGSIWVGQFLFLKGQLPNDKPKMNIKLVKNIWDLDVTNGLSELNKKYIYKKDLDVLLLSFS